MKIISLVVLILGCFLGAGFVSGREIACYFSAYGSSSYWGIILAGVLFFILLYLFFLLSSRVNSFSDFVLFYFGKFGKCVTFLFCLCIFILITSMIAGTFSIANAFDINPIPIVAITLIFSYLSVVGNLKVLSKINMILIPLILITILIVCKGNTFEITTSDISLSMLFSSSNYVFINIVTLGIFVLEIGGSYTGRQKLWATIISTIIIVVFMGFINAAIIKNNLITSAMPILHLSYSYGSIMSIITGLVIWSGLFTTIISCLFLLSNFINRYIKNYKLSVLFILLFALCVSGIGFEVIVGYVYSLIGVVGIIFIFFISKKEREIYITKISRKK